MPVTDRKIAAVAYVDDGAVPYHFGGPLLPLLNQVAALAEVLP